MMKRSASIVLAAALVPMIACSTNSHSLPDVPPPVDAAPPLDVQPIPEPKPLTACNAVAESIDLGTTETAEPVSYYASAFYFLTPTSVQRTRPGAPAQTLVRDGQAYPRLGATATIALYGGGTNHPLTIPGGGFDCGSSVLLPLTLGYRATGPTGTIGGQMVVLVDDLTQELTHVLASGETYDGEIVDKVFALSQYGACGRVVVNVQLASGRTLLVLRDPQVPQLKTLLTIASPSGADVGQPIADTTDRFLGRLVSNGTLEQDQLTFQLEVDSATKNRLGYILGSLDLTSGNVTCRITDTDIPCATRRPMLGLNSAPWIQAGDTAASVDSVLTVVRGNRVAQEINAGANIAICEATGEVFLARSFSPAGLGKFVYEVYVLRRSGAIERVTRNLELALSDSPRATNLDGFQITQKCDVIQNIRIPSGGTQLAIYWVDGTFAYMPISYPYYNRGYEGETGVPMMRNDGSTMIIREPSGSCQVPADVFPSLTR